MRTIHLYSTNATLRRYVRDTLASSQTKIVEHCGPAKAKTRANVNEVNHEGVFIPLPIQADFVLTKASLNLKTEYLAARLGALPVVLPEAEEWLLNKLEQSDEWVMVGSDQVK